MGGAGDDGEVSSKHSSGTDMMRKGSGSSIMDFSDYRYKYTCEEFVLIR